MRRFGKKKMIYVVFVMIIFYLPATCWSNTFYAQSETTENYPKSWASKAIPVPADEPEPSWIKKNWMWVLLGVLVVGAGAAAAGGGGGGGSSEEEDTGSMTFTW